MTLDLDALVAGWDCPPGELRARLITGRDGCEHVQVRLDLGLLQMHMTGRPDGQRHRGHETARAWIEHELRVQGNVISNDWQCLQREIQQFNYRRLAYVYLAEEALQQDDSATSERFINGALGDISACLAGLEVAQQHAPPGVADESLLPTLLFDAARLQTQLCLVQGRVEEAVERAERGAKEVAALLAELEYDEEAQAADPAVSFLRDLARQLRIEHGVGQTLQEQLDEALEREDFEGAAKIRDAMQRRGAAEN